MAYDLALSMQDVSLVQVAPRPSTLSAKVEVLAGSFKKFERLVVLAGASATGALMGFVAAMSLGRIDLWQVVLLAAPFFILSFHLTRETLCDAFDRKAYGCAAATTLHAGALLAWPITTLFAPLELNLFWTAPVTAITALALLSMCWTGSSRAIYRTCLQGALVAMVALQQGTMLSLGS
jgi:hypothetical protein